MPNLHRPAGLLVASFLVLGAAEVHAQDFRHPVPWVPERSVVCVPTPTSSTSSLEDDLTATRAGGFPRTALELAATCAVTRHTIAEAFNEGGLVRHRAGDFAASAASFEQAVIADPSYLEARFNFACALARLGNPRAAIAEIGFLASARRLAQPWLQRVATEPDLESVRGDTTLQEYVSGQTYGVTAHTPFPAPRGLPVPAITGPVFEPLTSVPWDVLRRILSASPSLSGQRGMQPIEPYEIRHPSLEARVPLDSAGYFRPERGQVFLVIPFTIPGREVLEGILVLHWNGSAFEPACHEYCSALGDPRYRSRHYLTDRPNEIQVVRCNFDYRARCSTRLIQTEGRVARFRGSDSLPDVQPPGPARVEPN
jgi:hypothetical protein